ncbi:1225_t:CDS:2 [Cetraspora pellucida]|uniref:1225_t:CDS:1 n=2 Tax=Cetraspora pellucida TaxID=1433469 RepID=A0ACA9L2X5_9GLOM|nr:1222_t:CDS:2 [Cetraspora pellucida]CAG8504025.1 1225_t:CDS:2 [Cetraspora pellucida]
MGNIKDKTLPFIPSYLRNSPLDIFNRTAKTPILLPTKCRKKGRIRYGQILDNELGIIYTGVASTRVFLGNLYPVIGIGTRGARIEANFGAKPFKFDIDFHARSILAKVMMPKIIITDYFSSETEDLEEGVCIVCK